MAHISWLTNICRTSIYNLKTLLNDKLHTMKILSFLMPSVHPSTWPNSYCTCSNIHLLLFRGLLRPSCSAYSTSNAWRTSPFLENLGCSKQATHILASKSYFFSYTYQEGCSVVEKFSNYLLLHFGIIDPELVYF